MRNLVKTFIIIGTLLVFHFTHLFSQSILIDPQGDGGFENGNTLSENGWTVVNHTVNQWFVGDASTPTEGDYAAYVSNDGGITNAYTNNVAQVSHFYRDVTVPTDENVIYLSFKWKALAQSCCDFLRVWVTPTTYNPVAGTLTTVGNSGGTQILGNLNNQSTYQDVVGINLSQTLAGTTFRLVFEWRNDAVTGDNPPASVDEILLTSEMPSVTNTGGVFTIDNALPTGGTNFNSFSEAIIHTNAGITNLAGNLIFNVLAGQEFLENVPPLIATGNVDYSITFQKSGAGNNPKIRPTGTTSFTDFGFCIQGGDYIIMDGIDIQSAAGNLVENGYRILQASATNGVQNIIIRNCKIVLNNTNDISRGIIQLIVSTPTSDSGTNRNNTYENIIVENVHTGIVLTGSTSTTFRDINNVITHCTLGADYIVNPTGSIISRGIWISHNDGANIYNNIVRNVVSSTSSNIQGILVENVRSTVNIHKNRVYGIKITNTLSTPVATGILVVLNTASTLQRTANIINNMVYDISTSYVNNISTVLVSGITIGDSNNQNTYNVLNNSVRIDGSNSLGSSNTCMNIVNAISTNNIRNNIFANFTPNQTAGGHYCIRTVSNTAIGSATSVMNTNNYYIQNPDRGHVGITNTTNRTTLENWKTAITGNPGIDINSVTHDPNFVLPNNLKIARSSNNMDSIGTPLTEVLVDFEGDLRDETNPDIGVDEYTPLSGIDLSVMTLHAPGTTGCFTNTETVSVVLKNNSSTTHNFVTDPAIVTVVVTGAHSYNQSFEVNTGTLNSLEDMIVTMPVNLDMLTFGDYIFNAFVEVAGDIESNNDGMYPVIRTIIPNIAIQDFSEDFSMGTSTPELWSTIDWSINATHGNSDNGLFKQFAGSTPSSFYLPRLTEINDSSAISFDYRLINTGDYPLNALPNSPAWGSINIEVSLNCGVSFQPFQTIDPNNHISKTGWKKKSYSLSEFEGETISIRFTGQGVFGPNWIVDFDNFNMPGCTDPLYSPENIVFTPLSLFSLSAVFNQAQDNPTGYLVVRYPLGENPENPLDGYNYVSGNVIGTGTVVYFGSNTGFTDTGLMPETSYDYYIYSFNRTSCGGGPVFKTENPLMGTGSTLPCTGIGGVFTIGQTGANFTGIAAALAQFQTSGITGHVVLELQSDFVHTGNLVLGSISCAGDDRTITIRPASNVTEALIISTTNGITIDINQGKYYIIDGRPGGSGSESKLIIRSTSNNPAFRFINGGNYNQIKYCLIQSNNISSSSGTILFSSSSNSYNSITHCEITGFSTLPFNAINSNASFNNLNSFNTFSNNLIYNFDRNGITLNTYNSSVTITGNSFYQTTPRTVTTNLVMGAINISSSFYSNFNITGNFIGGSQPMCGGDAASFTCTNNFSVKYTGINISADTMQINIINENTIKKVFLQSGPNVTGSNTTTFTGISVVGGRHEINDNIIGDSLIYNIIQVRSHGNLNASGFNYGILLNHSTNLIPAYFSVENNYIGGIEMIKLQSGSTSQFTGISVRSKLREVVIRNNVIGSKTTANSISNQTGSLTRGIYLDIESYGATVENNYIANISSVGKIQMIFLHNVKFSNIRKNVIRNIAGNDNGDQDNYGIILTSDFNPISHNVSENVIHDISIQNDIYNSYLTGILMSSWNAISFLEKNLIYNLFATSSNPNVNQLVFGINPNGSALKCQNNMVQLGRGMTEKQNFFGFWINTEGGIDILHNTIHIEGQGNSQNDSYAFYKQVDFGNAVIKNNIFSNTRSNTGSGKNYAVRLYINSDTVIDTLDYNDYHIEGGNTYLGYFNHTDYSTLSAWQTATSQDMNTITDDPLFVDPDATVPDLHLTPGSPCESAGLLIASVIDDFDGDIRADYTPTDIGADAGDYAPPCAPVPTAEANGNNNLCVGATLNLVGTTDIGTSFLWTGPNGFTSTEQNPEITTLPRESAGIYYFVATADDCSSEPAPFELILNGLEVWTGDDSGSGTLRGALVCAQNGDIITIDENVSQINFIAPLSIQKNVSIHDNFNQAAILYFDFDLSGFDIAEFGLEIDGNVHLKNLDIRHKNNSPIKPLLLNKSFLDLENITFRGATPPYLIHENEANINIIANTQVIVLE